jgi:hypothetical protein
MCGFHPLGLGSIPSRGVNFFIYFSNIFKHLKPLKYIFSLYLVPTAAPTKAT